jgi:hypothetical protein
LLQVRWPAVDQPSPEQILEAELSLPAALIEHFGDLVAVQIAVLIYRQQDG